MLRVLFALSLFVAACTPGAPAPTVAPSTPAPTATVAPATPAPATATPLATTAAATPRPATPMPPAECDPRYDDCGASDTPPPEATPAADQVVIGTASDGNFLVDSDGFALYTFDDDQGGMSSCYGGCADNWPALVVADADSVSAGNGVTGTLGTTERNNGALQVTYNGRPLYYYAGDSAAGDTNGQGIGDVWFLAQP